MTFRSEEIDDWTDTFSLPVLPAASSVEVFVRMRQQPRLDVDDPLSWRARPNSEMHATNHKPLMELDSDGTDERLWPIYKGKSFNIWQPDTGDYYAWADKDKIREWMQAKRMGALRRPRGSVYGEFSADFINDIRTLACQTPRIVFRDVARATDARTVIACLIPPQVFIQNSAPYLLWPRGDAKDQAFLLGLLSSIPLDWYARNFVELHLNYFIFNPLPVPRPQRSNPLWQRVVDLSGRLASPDDRFAGWAEAVGVECGPLDEEEKHDKIHELDAVVAHLYDLSEPQLIHVFETFHEKWNHAPRLRAVLRHWRDWAGKI